MTSHRLALPAAVLIGLALIPTLLHSYVGMRTDDGYTATAIEPRLAGLTSRPTERQAPWVKKFFDSDNWSERRYLKPGGGEITLFVSRSYDLKRLYHHPELAIAYGSDLREAGVHPLTGTNDVTVHVLRGNAERGDGIALYALLYDGEFVDDLFTFQIRTAGELLFSARRPMTLFFAHDPTAPSNARLEESLAARVLAAAITSFRSQTPSIAGK